MIIVKQKTMKGDFSKWRFDPRENFDGVLHQQGRVLLDSDWNAETDIKLNWQDEAARDIIGAGVAAVPVRERDRFMVRSAAVDNGGVELYITPGRLWVDGLLVYLSSEETDLAAAVRRIATYLQPPIQDPAFDTSTIGEGVRDAVVLEVWREAMNGFQMPGILIEPALGGPDTTERAHAAMAFRLLRLGPGENCENIRDRLRDDFSQKGKLRVTLEPTVDSDEDCSTVKGGGYTGLEHHLYRIEMAEVDSGGPMFKWSQFNGGLVGRGTFDATPDHEKVVLKDNDQPIITSGLSECYLEVAAYDEDLGHWKVTFGAKFTLNSDHELVLLGAPLFGSMPSTGETVFFRLWNDIRDISEFPVGPEPVELRDGIRLEFDPSTGVNYRAGDYWTFEVRAGEIRNPEVLIDTEPPQGIRYHRVPLAILNWDSDRSITYEEGRIDDCREPFQPLTNLQSCCTFSVGDGRQSQGDFNSIEEALEQLPRRGGQICLLPGRHRANVSIVRRENIRISGCGRQSLVYAGPNQPGEPIFFIQNSSHIQLDHMILCASEGTAIRLEDTPGYRPASQGIVIEHNHIVAGVHAIYIGCDNMQAGKNDIRIAHNAIGMLDKEGGRAAIFSIADEVLIEGNRVALVPVPDPNIIYSESDLEALSVYPDNPCADSGPAGILRLRRADHDDVDRSGTVVHAMVRPPTASPAAPPPGVYLAQGGIQVGDSSERVRVVENEVVGGWGHGVVLGSEVAIDEEELKATRYIITVEEIEKYIAGVIWKEGEPKADIKIGFEREDGRIFTDTTNSDGEYGIRPMESGHYLVSIITPGYEIIDVERDFDSTGEFTRHHIKIVKIELKETFAFLYGISIENNTIYDMGSSGIGSYDFLDAENDNFKVEIEELTINDNTIENYAQQVPAEIPESKIRKIGFGGIALSHCERTFIKGNILENNQLTNVDPVSGIFIRYADKLEIAGNSILNKKKVDGDLSQFPKRGVRSGIFIGMCTASAGGSFALKVTDNTVAQFMGQALVAAAAGPVKVLGNIFTAEGISVAANTATPFAGAVHIRNLGKSKNLYNLLFSSKLFPGINLSNLDQSPWIAVLPYGYYFPPGNVEFDNNQTTLDLQSMKPEYAYCSQIIESWDDISFNANQSDCYFALDFLLANTILFGITARSSNNRFKESLLYAFLSLFSFALVNTNTDNQGTHCMAATGRVGFDERNIAIFPKDCEGPLEEFFKKHPNLMLKK